MIVLTDGESHDGEELEDALEECEKRNVTRYAIAVLGHYIRRKKDPNSFINEIKYIASDPDEKYFFNVTDEAALNDIIGSYFGSEVCPVDVNGDGVTDVLLSLLTFNGTLFPDPKPQDARFGYAMLAVPDLNHDSFNDVVVGAPLEDNHQGAVYLYHGYRTTVLPRFKQRIESAAFHLGLRYFGRSLDGQIDMDGDGLVDLAVGAQDAAVVLRIVQINASISVNPPSINVIQKNCQRNGKESLCVTANFCFSVSSRSLGPRDSHLSIKYNISLDDRKFGTRAVFDSSSQKLLQKRTRATVGRTACSTARFHIIDTSDYLRPVTITMKFALSENESPGPVLDEKLPTTVKKLIPFFKDCGEDDECVTDLVLQAEMDINGSRQKPHVIRKGKRKMVVDVLLENKKENAYNTTLQIWFSRNLHFSSLGFKVKLTASSDSSELNQTMTDNTVQPTAFVSYEPDLFLTSESTLNRYEVHPVGTFPSDMSPEFRTTIKIQNLACYAISNLSLLMAFPATGYQGREFLWVTRILADNATCSLTNHTEFGSANSVIPLHPEELAHTDRVNCTNAGCQVVTCQLQRLERSSEVTIHLLRAVRNEFFRKAKFKTVKIISSITLNVRKEDNLFLLPKAAHQRQVGFFIHKKPGEDEKEE
ncbi:hypothetical protein E2320_013663 [Naja naja]|nr:hypothetical protein E2320_013663 [Naja naja]